MTKTLQEGQRIGAYRIVRLLGQGGMGAVYEARQEPLDRRVALKTLHDEDARNEEAVGRFFNEAKVLSRLEHPSIVQVSDFGRAEDGTAYLVMEYLRGQSLARRLTELASRGERMNAVTALQLGWQIADVLAVAHASGIVHRDIKPDNLMLVADPVAPGGERVKILDFGIAKLTRPEDRGGVKTDTQAVMGTPLYMSPEQCAGAGGVDAKSDVYSLGCVLYEVLAGRTPFVAEGAGRLIGMHLYQQPPPLASHAAKLPAGVAELVHRMLTKDKPQRPSMNDIADDMGRLLAKLSGAGPVVRSRLPTVTDPNATRAIVVPEAASTLGQSIGQSSRRRLRSRVVAAGLAGAGLLALIIALFYRQNSQPISTAPRPDLSVAAPPTDKAAATRVDPPPPQAPSPDSKPKPTAGGATSVKPGPAPRDGATSKPTTPSNKPTTIKPATSKPATSKPTTTTNSPKRIGYED
jgi:serine/threonine-protein kinase